MNFNDWVGLLGAMLLVVALTSALIRPLPISASMLYLAAGVAIGPLGLDLLDLNVIASSNWLERASAIVVIVSLFVGGLKLRLSPRDRAWIAAYRLAGPVMVLSIAGVALAARVLFAMDWPAAILLGAILAPTDPVLAGEVSVRDARDHDRLRYGLSGEAGLNDGTAFPFVALGLGLVASSGDTSMLGGWFLDRVLYAVPAGLVLGYVMGRLAGSLAIAIRQRTREGAGGTASDFLALALIGLSYWAAEIAHAWGFLAVFAAGLGLRHAEVLIVRNAPPPEQIDAPTEEPEHPDETPAERLVEREVSEEALAHPAVASGALLSEILTFGETLERLLGVFVVILVGVLASRHFDPVGIPLALLLMLVIRPAAVFLGLIGTPTRPSQRVLMGWFGIRGIGSLYYLAYAIGEGIGPARAAQFSDLVVTTVAASILLHGTSVTPLLNIYEKALEKRAEDKRKRVTLAP